MKADTKPPLLTSRTIAVTAIYISILLVMNWTPWLGFIPSPPAPAKITFLLIPILIAAQNEGLFVGVVVSTIFGILSFLSAVTTASSFGLAPFLVNPMVSVFPRACIGVSVYFTFKALKKYKRYLAAVVSAAAGVVTNTGMVILMLLLFNGGGTVQLAGGAQKAMTAYALGLISLNFLIEFTICLVVVPAATAALYKFKNAAPRAGSPPYFGRGILEEEPAPASIEGRAEGADSAGEAPAEEPPAAQPPAAQPPTTEKEHALTEKKAAKPPAEEKEKAANPPALTEKKAAKPPTEEDN